jgi:NAD-dependent SIR2 family protein deacetylase
VAALPEKTEKNSPPWVIPLLIRRVPTDKKSIVVGAEGTSGVVYPAASFPKIAMNRGARCIEINPEPNEASYLYLETIREPAGKGLMRLFEDML